MPAGDGACHGGRHVAAGAGAMAAVAGALGLPAPPDWRLSSLCAATDGVRVVVRGGSQRIAFLVQPPGTQGALVQAGGFALSCEGPAGAPARRFLRAVATRLRALGFEDIVRLIEDDPLSFTEQGTPGQPRERLRVPYVGPPIGLWESGWRNFFADQDFEILVGVPSADHTRTIDIEITDRECFYSRPAMTRRKWSFLDWPVETHEDDRSGDGPASRHGDGRNSLVVDLEEEDLILGSGAKADALVEAVRQRAATAGCVVITHLCTPIVIGEDFGALARRIERSCDRKVVQWSQRDRDQLDSFGEHLRHLLGREGTFAAVPDERSLNLFHFPREYREEELLPFLSDLGLRVEVCAFPDVDLPSLERLGAAHWQVFCERASYPTKLRELLARSPRPVLDVRAPYGLSRTRECLGAIAAAAGRREAFADVWCRRFGPLEREWHDLRAWARELGVAFVVSEATLPRLWGLRFGQAAPLVPCVREMGFRVHVLYYDPHGEPPSLPEGEEADVVVFRTPTELAGALAGPGFEAVYSDLCFDWRLNAAGKARFSTRDFEMGAGGALRTLRRLLALCRLPFFARYRAHLERRAVARG